MGDTCSQVLCLGLCPTLNFLSTEKFDILENFGQMCGTFAGYCYRGKIKLRDLSA